MSLWTNNNMPNNNMYMNDIIRLISLRAAGCLRPLLHCGIVLARALIQRASSSSHIFMPPLHQRRGVRILDVFHWDHDICANLRDLYPLLPGLDVFPDCNYVLSVRYFCYARFHVGMLSIIRPS